VRVRPVAAVLLTLLVALPWVCGGERRTLDEQQRRLLPAGFVNLENGRTRFDLRGATPAEAIVFVHGLSSPSSVWGELPKAFRDSGYLTLTYDLYGRGWSDRPWGRYDLDLFDHQLAALLPKLGLTRRVHLVGLSMGGIIASEFTLRRPTRVASLSLLAPAGFEVAEPPGTALLTAPLVGDYLMQVLGNRVLISGIARSVHDKSLAPKLETRFRPQLEYAGYKRALLSTLRHMPLSDFTARYAELGKAGLPVQVIWGRQDEVTPIAGIAKAATLLPAAEIREIDGAGHLVHFEKPDEVFSAVLGFLRGHEAPRQEPEASRAGQ